MDIFFSFVLHGVFFAFQRGGYDSLLFLCGFFFMLSNVSSTAQTEIVFQYQFRPGHLYTSGSKVSLSFFSNLASRKKTSIMIILPNLGNGKGEDSLEGLRNCKVPKNIIQ